MAGYWRTTRADPRYRPESQVSGFVGEPGGSQTNLIALLEGVAHVPDGDPPILAIRQGDLPLETGFGTRARTAIGLRNRDVGDSTRRLDGPADGPTR